MAKILIVDPCKSSLVMTSEVFKDKLPGSAIEVTSTGQQCLEVLDETFDMLVIDFDLPDADGVMLTKHVRKKYDIPIIMTAFPEKIVREAVSRELFPYHDSAMWVAKPVRFDELAEKIDIFLINKKRLTKRFETDIAALLVGKGAGRGKRAPKVKGRIANIGIGGAMICLSDAMKMKIGDEIVVTLEMPVVGQKADPHEVDVKKVQCGPSKLRAKITWTNRKKNLAGVQFDRLTDSNKKSLEIILRGSKEIDLL